MNAFLRIAALAASAAMPVAADAACSVTRLVELPVTMTADYKPLVPARINGMDVRFIADSGAFYSLISPGTAGAAGLRLGPAPAGFRLGGVGGQTSASVASVTDLRLAGVKFPKMEFLVGGSDTGTAGLIGQNVLGFGDAEYDLPHGMIRLFKSHDCADKSLAYWSGTDGFFELKIDPLAEARFHTVGIVHVNGKPLRAMFDTGASRTELTRKAAERVGVFVEKPGVVAAPPSHGLGRTIIKAWTAPFDSIDIGGEQLHHVRVAIVDTEFSVADMIIGADFFISHRIYVDNGSHRMFFTYAGGKIFGTETKLGGEMAATPGTPAETAEPSDAEGYSRRGAVFLAQRDFARAIADFSKAIELAPKDPRFLLQRAEAYVRTGRRALGAADLNRAVELDPSNVAARIHRAQMRISIAERGGALADADAAAAATVGPVNDRLQIAALYVALDAYDRAIAQLDLWIRAHPEDAGLPAALNERCWARALAGKELDKALSDCNAALRRRPKTPGYLDSRGLVRLRLADYDHAIEDYDAALQANPKMAWSLYGRGLARRHKGLNAEAEADLKAAAALQPDIAERARKAGIS
jgi:tetratricopeptide (TPR) repeat protein/predicted aspartyl protease